MGMNYEKNLRGQRGITLIALVITIIVLLILAAVTTATLTGENGILTQAGKAKTETNNANIEEQVKLAFLGSYGTDGKIVYSELQTNLNNIEGMAGVPDTITEESFPLTVTVNGEEVKISEDSTIFNSGEWDKTATPEDCFIWGSDTTGEKGYDVIIGYAEKLQNEVKLKIPSRCVRIEIGSYDGYGGTRSFCSSIKTVEIPNTVTEMGGWSFSGFQTLESVTLSESLTRIGDDEFNDCYNLSSITIPNSVTSIGDCAFYNCASLNSVTIPSSITSIEGHTFHGCTGLSSITIPNSVTSIEYYSFSGCTNLSSITVPSSVSRIDPGAFAEWTSSQTINIQGYTSAPSGWDSRWNSGCSATINWGQ